MNGLRYRLVMFIVQFAISYLKGESEYEPTVDILHLDEEVRITFEWPPYARMPTVEMLVREKL